MILLEFMFLLRIIKGNVILTTSFFQSARLKTKMSDMYIFSERFTEKCAQFNRVRRAVDIPCIHKLTMNSPEKLSTRLLRICRLT